MFAWLVSGRLVETVSECDHKQSATHSHTYMYTHIDRARIYSIILISHTHYTHDMMMME